MILFTFIITILTYITIIVSSFDFFNTFIYFDKIIYLTLLLLFTIAINSKHNKLKVYTILIPLFLILILNNFQETYFGLLLLFFILSSLRIEFWQLKTLAILSFLTIFLLTISQYFIIFNEYFVLENIKFIILILTPITFGILLQKNNYFIKFLILITLVLSIKSNGQVNFSEILNLWQLPKNYTYLTIINIVLVVWIMILLLKTFILNAITAKNNKITQLSLLFSLVITIFLIPTNNFFITLTLVFITAIVFMINNQNSIISKNNLSKRSLKIGRIITLIIIIFSSYQSYLTYQSNYYFKKSLQNSKQLNLINKSIDYKKTVANLLLKGDILNNKKSGVFYENALKIAPNNTKILAKLNHFYSKNNQITKQIRLLKKWLTIEQKNQIYLDLALALRKKSKYKEVLNLYKNAYQSNKNNLDYCYYYGVSLASNSQIYKAYHILNECKQKSNHPERFNIILKAIEDKKMIIFQ